MSCAHPTPAAVDRAVGLASAMAGPNVVGQFVRRTLAVTVAPGAVGTVLFLAVLPTVFFGIGVGLVQAVGDVRAQVQVFASDPRRALLGQNAANPASASTLGGTDASPCPSPILPTALATAEAMEVQVTNAGAAVVTAYVTAVGVEMARL